MNDDVAMYKVSNDVLRTSKRFMRKDTSEDKNERLAFFGREIYTNALAYGASTLYFFDAHINGMHGIMAVYDGQPYDNVEALKSSLIINSSGEVGKGLQGGGKKAVMSILRQPERGKGKMEMHEASWDKTEDVYFSAYGRYEGFSEDGSSQIQIKANSNYLSKPNLEKLLGSKFDDFDSVIALFYPMITRPARKKGVGRYFDNSCRDYLSTVLGDLNDGNIDIKVIARDNGKAAKSGNHIFPFVKSDSYASIDEWKPGPDTIMSVKNKQVAIDDLPFIGDYNFTETVIQQNEEKEPITVDVNFAVSLRGSVLKPQNGSVHVDRVYDANGSGKGNNYVLNRNVVSARLGATQEITEDMRRCFESPFSINKKFLISFCQEAQIAHPRLCNVTDDEGISYLKEFFFEEKAKSIRTNSIRPMIYVTITFTPRSPAAHGVEFSLQEFDYLFMRDIKDPINFMKLALNQSIDTGNEEYDRFRTDYVNLFMQTDDELVEFDDNEERGKHRQTIPLYAMKLGTDNILPKTIINEDDMNRIVFLHDDATGNTFDGQIVENSICSGFDIDQLRSTKSDNVYAISYHSKSQPKNNKYLMFSDINERRYKVLNVVVEGYDNITSIRKRKDTGHHKDADDLTNLGKSNSTHQSSIYGIYASELYGVYEKDRLFLNRKNPAIKVVFKKSDDARTEAAQKRLRQRLWAAAKHGDTILQNVESLSFTSDFKDTHCEACEYSEERWIVSAGWLAPIMEEELDKAKYQDQLDLINKSDND